MLVKYKGPMFGAFKPPMGGKRNLQFFLVSQVTFICFFDKKEILKSTFKKTY